MRMGYLREQVSQDMRRRIAGYYTLASASLPPPNFLPILDASCRAIPPYLLYSWGAWLLTGHSKGKVWEARCWQTRSTAPPAQKLSPAPW